MKSNILCVFAQLAEARALIEYTHAQPVPGEFAHVWSEGKIPSLYTFDNGWIAISGVGVHSAQMTVSKYGPFCHEVWNAGLAGSLGSKLPLGDLLNISTIGKYIPLELQELDERSQECVAFTLPHFSLQEGKSKLISSDFPIHDLGHRNRLGKEWDLVDMEGYGIAYASLALEKKCRMWKIVSDFASPGGRELIRKHKIAYSEIIAENILSCLKKI